MTLTKISFVYLDPGNSTQNRNAPPNPALLIQSKPHPSISQLIRIPIQLSLPTPVLTDLMGKST
jgi:hypothetical protein